MGNLKTRKQIAACLNEANVSLWDKKTKSELRVDVLELLADFIVGKKTAVEFEEEVETTRFVMLIDDFVIDNHSEQIAFEFYAQHRRELSKSKAKELVFKKRFKIEDIKKFKTEYKKLQWYTEDFYDDDLRENIIDSQEGRCGLCNVNISSDFPHLHHIDYDKANCKRENLVFLCPRCHGKTNSNRDFWQKLLTEKQEELINGRSKEDARGTE